MNILITGTSSGVGAGLSKWYLDQGHKVYGISRNTNDALQKNKNYYFLALDLTQFDKMEKLIPAFLAGIEMFDKVILNAGKLNSVRDIVDTPLVEIKNTMDINVWANKVLIEILVNHQIRVKQVLAISSGAAVSGARGWNAYSLSKATLNMLINLYAKELDKTHFTALAPGLIDTGMQEYIFNLPDDDKYPVVQKLKNARGTDAMPNPEQAAPIIANAIERCLQYESGSFLDIRQMD